MSDIINAFKKYGAPLRKLKINSDVLFIGTLPSKDDENKTTSLRNSVKTLIYLSPIQDPLLQNIAKKYVKYEVGCEVGVLALLAQNILRDKDLPKEVKEYLDELDEGYLSAESNVGEEEIEEILELLGDRKFTLLLGEDLKDHPDIDTIAGLASLICRFVNVDAALMDGSELKEEENFLLPPKIRELKSFDGAAIYFYPCEKEDGILYGSSQFAIAAKIKDKEEITIVVDSGEYKRVFELSDKLKGTIAILGVNGYKGFRYEIANIKGLKNG